jgi:hypothetical protein
MSWAVKICFNTAQHSKEEQEKGVGVHLMRRMSF